MKKYPILIFSDFDGTITTQDTLEGFMQLFLDKSIYAVSQRMFEQGYTIKQGVQETMCRVDESDYLTHTNYFQNLPLREGFEDFLDFLKGCSLPLVVISGGIRDMIDATLSPYQEKILDTYAADITFSSGKVKISSAFESDEEIVSKRQVMALYTFDTSICIGDSYTDFQMALACDVVFARDRLADAMKKTKKPYYEYETFYNIIRQLKQIFKGD